MSEITKQHIKDFSKAIEDGQDAVITEKLHDLHPADIAEVLDFLDFEEARYIVKILDIELAAKVMVELEDDVRDRLIASLTSREIAELVIENIDTDDAADVLAELPQGKKEEVIGLLEDIDHASDLVDLLTYEEDTAGGLMAKELIKVNINWPVPKAIREMRRQAEEVEEVYTIYVVDDKNQLCGKLSLKKLLFNSSLRATIQDIYNPGKLQTVLVDEEAEEVARLMSKYDLVVLPVVDETGTLLGRITIDDVVDVIQEEAERDYQMASGISENVESDDNVFLLTRARLPWLVIGLVGGIFSSRVIALYETELQINPSLAFFMPLIAATGGNVGVQSSAIVVQGLASNTFEFTNLFTKLKKELAVASINAIICSLLVLAYDMLFMNDISLGYTVALALFSVIICASLFGTLVPIALNRLDIDPALATGPFITTANDIIGLIIYFSIGRLMYGI